MLMVSLTKALSERGDEVDLLTFPLAKTATIQRGRLTRITPPFRTIDSCSRGIELHCDGRFRLLAI